MTRKLLFPTRLKQLVAVVFLLTVSSVFGQTKLVHFSGYNSATSTFPISQGSSNFNSTLVSSATLNYGGTGMITNNDSRSWWYFDNSSATLDPSTAPYLEYSINFLGNANIDFDRFVLTGADNIGDPGTKFELRWSVDNYVSNLGLFTLQNNYCHRLI